MVTAHIAVARNLTVIALKYVAFKIISTYKVYDLSGNN